jgi:hypothetical protein
MGENVSEFKVSSPRVTVQSYPINNNFNNNNNNANITPLHQINNEFARNPSQLLSPASSD